ncbi:MAG: YpsA SLOG family protein [Methylocella sp.]
MRFPPAFSVVCLGRPYLIQVVDQPHAAVQLSQWLSDRSREKAIHTLNIAGPRNSEAPELYDQAKALLETALPLFSGAANAARRGTQSSHSRSSVYFWPWSWCHRRGHCHGDFAGPPLER